MMTSVVVTCSHMSATLVCLVNNLELDLGRDFEGGSRYATRAFATPIFVASATPIFVASATPYFRISATQTAATPKILF